MKQLMALLAIAGLLLTAAAPSKAAAAKTQIGWSFGQGATLQGWQPNSDIKNVRVEDGALRGEVTNWDPFLTSPVFEIPATPWQWVELEIQSDKSGQGQLYYSNTMQSEYAGFFPGKCMDFNVPGDNQWHTLRIYPFWQGEKKIIHVRVDLFNGAHFAIRAIRIMEPAENSPVSQTSAWNFAQGAQDWTPVTGVSDPATTGKGIQVKVADAGGMLRSPLLSVPLAKRTWVAVRMRVRKATRASLAWVTENASGLHEMGFPVRPDNRFHTYNVDAGSSTAWDGTLISLALRPSNAAEDEVEIASVSLEEEATGAPDLNLSYFGMENAVNRVGKPCPLVAKFVNSGGQTAVGLKAHLTLPKGVTARPLPKAATPSFECQVPAAFRFVLTAKRPVDGKVTLRLSGPGAPEETFTAPIHITAAPKLPQGRIPAVHPAKTDYLVGTYYFPGWPSASKWECIDRVAPIRKPILGYYDEANPECADWQIKWAVEHGINFFLVDWYWCQGNRSLEHWVNNAYMKSRNRRYLKWAVMWANHNPANTHSEEDWIKVTQYWIDHFFGMKEYLRIDGKPAVFIWAPYNIRRDMGGSEQAAKLYALSQEMAKKAGYPGITFAAMNAGGSPGEAKELAAEGYAVNATYHWWGDAPQVATDPKRFPYSLVVDRSEQTWEDRDKVVKAAGMTYIPTADTGWDSRPWHGDSSMVIYDRTPAQFERLLRKAKSFLDARGEKMLILGPCNEWGEGSYIEPCTEYGFGMYDAVRRVFCKEPAAHTDVTPADVHLGPYDLMQEAPQTRTSWNFDKDSEGWSAAMGLKALEVQKGVLHTTSIGDDPAFGLNSILLQARKYACVAVRMKVQAGANTNVGGIQLFWSTANSGISEGNSVTVPVIADGAYHTYLLPVGENPRWHGIIRSFRLDPCSGKGVELWLDSIQLLKEKPAQE